MKKLFIPALLLIGIIAAYWAAFGNPIDKIFPPKAADPVVPANTSTTKSAGGSFTIAPKIVQDAQGFPLMQGSRNTFVLNLQKALNDRFGSELELDGVFGIKTAKALSAHNFSTVVYHKHYAEITKA